MMKEVTTLNISADPASWRTRKNQPYDQLPKEGVQIGGHRITKGYLKKLVYSAPLIWLPIQHKTGTSRALLDSGSSVNFIHPNFLPYVNSAKVGEQTLMINGVHGSKTGLTNWHVIELILGNGRAVHIPCIELEKPGIDILLGLPFMYQIQGSVDSKHQLLHTDVGDFDLKAAPIKAVDIMCQDTKEVKEKPKKKTKLTEQHEEELEKAFQQTMLEPPDKERFKELFIKYHVVWTKSGVGKAIGVEHEIVTTTSKPIVLPPRYVPLKYQQALEKELTKMEKDGVVGPSTSPYCAYPVIVPKKDTDEIRLAIDYRSLNDVTVSDKGPIPKIDDLMQATEGSRYFILLDLRAGFWQIPMAAASQHLTAFRGPRGLLEFKVMAFGLKNAPATFQRWVNDMLFDLRYEGVLVYIDDVLIHAESLEKLYELTEKVLERFEEYGAQIKMTKCHICPHEVPYLGHILTKDGRRPSPTKIRALLQVRAPTSQKEVRSILGALGYFRNYVPEFSEILAPLTNLTKKEATMEWNIDLHTRLLMVLQVLSQAVLRSGLKSERFVLETDASEVAVGCVLYDGEEYDQAEKHQRPLPIGFWSKKLNQCERNWSTMDREAYAVIWGLGATDAFVRGRKVKICTDHKNLLYILNASTGRLARWKSRLTEYEWSIEYLPGTRNLIADLMSRMTVEADPIEIDREFCYAADLEEEIEVVISEDEEFIEREAIIKRDLGGYSRRLPPNWPKPLAALPTEEELRIEQYIVNPNPRGAAWGRHSNGLVLYGQRYWVPPKFRDQILDLVHLNGTLWHPGSRAMLKTLRGAYNWEYMQDSIGKYLKSCVTCQRTRAAIHGDRTNKSHSILGPFETVYMDFWGPCRWKGDQYLLLNMIDYHTKWVETVIVPNKSSEEIAKQFFIHWISRYGAPKILVTDNDSPLIAAEIKGLASMLGVRKIQTTPYHPQGNSPVENFHGILKPALSKLRAYAENVITFEEAIAWILMSYRASPHSAILHSPSFFAHGIELKLTQDEYFLEARGTPSNETRLEILLTIRSEIMRKNAMLQEKAQEKAVHVEKFHLGDIILVRLTDDQFKKLGTLVGSRKLISHWSLPMTVIAKTEDGTVANLQCKGTGLYLRTHMDRCMKILPPTTPGQKDLWARILERETPLFKFIGVRASPPHSKLPPLPRTVARTLVRGGVNAGLTNSASTTLKNKRSVRNKRSIQVRKTIGKAKKKRKPITWDEIFNVANVADVPPADPLPEEVLLDEFKEIVENADELVFVPEDQNFQHAQQRKQEKQHREEKWKETMDARKRKREEEVEVNKEEEDRGNSEIEENTIAGRMRARRRKDSKIETLLAYLDKSESETSESSQPFPPGIPKTGRRNYPNIRNNYNIEELRCLKCDSLTCWMECDEALEVINAFEDQEESKLIMREEE